MIGVSMPYSSTELLPMLGFEPAAGNTFDDWTYQFGALEIGVIEGMDRWFKPALVFAGHYKDARTLSVIEFTLPALLESEEQSLAIIAYHVAQGVPLAGRPDWVASGLELQALLPWATGSSS
jgi:hypothetical protein